MPTMNPRQVKFIKEFKDLCRKYASSVMVGELVWIDDNGFLRVVGTVDRVFPEKLVKELNDELAAVADKWAAKATAELNRIHNPEKN